MNLRSGTCLWTSSTQFRHEIRKRCGVFSFRSLFGIHHLRYYLVLFEIIFFLSLFLFPAHTNHIYQLFIGANIWMKRSIVWWILHYMNFYCYVFLLLFSLTFAIHEKQHQDKRLKDKAPKSDSQLHFNNCMYYFSIASNYGTTENPSESKRKRKRNK